MNIFMTSAALTTGPMSLTRSLTDGGCNIVVGPAALANNVTGSVNTILHTLAGSADYHGE